MKAKIAFLGLFLAFAVVLGYVEFLIPFYFAIPGMKLGLPNLAILLCLYLYGEKEAFLVTTLRVVLCSVLFANIYSGLYSLTGAFLSLLIMVLLKKCKDRFSMIGVSIAGGIVHNIGQTLVAFIVSDTLGVFYYLPFLLISGAITGFLIGIGAKAIYPSIKQIQKTEKK